MGGGKVRLGLVQMSMGESPKENLAKALGMVADAASAGAQIICLPELFTSLYFAQQGNGRRSAAKLAETIPGPATKALSEAAAKHGAALVGGSIYEKSGQRLYNTSAVFDETGSMLGIYRKVHIPHDECFFEQDYFDPGDLGFRVFGAAGCKIAPLICYDQWFPEAARCVALLGAQIAFYPTAIGTVRGVEQAEGDWQQAWENVMRGHAIANGMAVAAVNRCGNEGRMDFWGGSFVIDAFGKTLARAKSKEEIVLATVDLQHGDDVKEGWGFFCNRRPGQYSKISEGKD